MHLEDSSLSALRLIDDYPSFALEPDSIVSDVLKKLGWIVRIREAPRRSKGSIAEQAAKALGVSVGSVHRYCKDFRESGWKGLRDERTAGLGNKGLHPLFKSYVAGVFDVQQRDDDGMEAYRTIITRWTSWRETGDPQFAIAGYDSCPVPDPKTGIPHGWSYDNLLRLRPKKAQRSMTKQGPKAASNFLPPVLTTRVGSAVLSRVLFDDQDLDNLIADGHLAVAGIKKTQKPVSFNALDFFTAAHLDHHLRAMYKDASTGKDKTLTGVEFAWFTIKVLQSWGYRTDDLGTEIIQEHGTAKTWMNKQLTSLGGHHSFEDALKAITGGKAFVNRSGRFDSPMFAEMCFRPSATGNFKFKTWLESAFRLLRTYMQALPGATGSRERDNGREETYGIRLAEKNLLTAIADATDPHTQERLRSLMRHELLDFQSLHQLVCAVYRAVNARTEHQLEGWHQCGFTLPLWRPSPTSKHWFAQHELDSIEDPEERRFLLKRLAKNPDELTTVEKLSPQSALDIELKRDQKVIAKLPDAYVGLLLPKEWALEKKVGRNHTFTLPNPLWPDTEETYVCSWDHKGMQVTLDSNKKLLVFHNPFFDGRAQVHSADDGSYITTLFPTVRAEPFRQDKTLVQLNVRSTVKSGHVAHVAARMADVAAERVQDREINRRLLKGLPVTDEERSDARSESGRKGQRTAAANRLQNGGEAEDWDNVEVIRASPISPSAFDSLAADDDVPDAF
jgi:hypothetical protein